MALDPKVARFLDSLRAKGMTEGDLKNLAHLQKNKKAWKGEASRITDRIKHGRTPAQQSAVDVEKSRRKEAAARRRKANINGGRGNPNFMSTTSESTNGGEGIARFVGDQFSKNNPKSIPNAAADGADKLVKGATGFMSGLGKRDQKVRAKLSKEALARARARRAALK